MKFILLILTLLTCLFTWAEVPEHLYLKSTPPVQLPNSARYMVYLETSANPIGQRSPRPFWIEHLEIPLSFLQEDKGEKLNQRIHDSMVFTDANGIKTVRWILNPEDTKYGDEIIEDLKSKGLTLERKRYFIGYSTSSRSCIVQDPVTGTTFSIKSSTNKTAGNWNDKKETVRAARAGRLMNDHIEKSRRARHNTVLKIVNEPLAFYNANVDQGIIIRQYDHFLNSSQDVKLIPVFAFIHRADDYARKAGFTGSTQDFIQESLVRMGGVVTAELALNYGIIYNSPHGQNFLIEVDKNEKPTGKLYARDYADSHLLEPIMKTTQHGKNVIEHYRTFTGGSNQILTTSLPLKFGPYYNGTLVKPHWVTNESQLTNEFKESLLKRMMTTLSLSGSSIALISHSSNSGYWGETLNMSDNESLRKWSESPIYTAPRTPTPRPAVVAPLSTRPPAEVVRSCRALFAS